MRIVTILLIVFVSMMLFFELSGIDPKLPTTKHIVEKQTVLIETIDPATGEVINHVVNQTANVTIEK